MIKLEIKNIKELDEKFRNDIIEICEEKFKYFEDLFKKYSKNLTLEVLFNKTEKIYTAIISLNLKSKKILLAEDGTDIKSVTTTLFSKFKKVAKKQYELEKKEYEYKRKR